MTVMDVAVNCGMNLLDGVWLIVMDVTISCRLNCGVSEPTLWCVMDVIVAG